jgi:hypothetical protein
MAEFNGGPLVDPAIARARAALSPTAADAQRVRLAIDAALAAGVAATATAAPTARPARARPSAPAAWGGSKLSVVALTAGLTALLAGSAGYLVGHRAAARQVQAPLLPATVVEIPASAIEPAGPTAAAPIPLASVMDGVLPAGSSAASARRIGRAARVEGGVGAGAGAADSSLDQEVRALRSVERALRDRQPGLALALLAALDRDVPGGKLVEEREAMLVIARCLQTDAPIRVELEGAFAGRYPGSVYLQRVKQVCGPRSPAVEQRIGGGVETDGK